MNTFVYCSGGIVQKELGLVICIDKAEEEISGLVF